MSRQFSQDEAQDIFARAAQRQHATDMRGEGLTLAELQEIGRAAGLDPEHVAAAVADAGQRPVEPAVYAGVNVTPRASRVVSGEMTDDVWEQVVARLRQTFETQGVASDVGRVREWTSGSDSNLLLTAEPAPGGTAVTITTSREKEGKDAAKLPLYGTIAAAAMAAFLLAGEFPAHYPWLIPGLIVAVMLVMALGIRQSLAGWSARRQGQFDGLLDQIDLLARDATTDTARLGDEVEPLAADSLDPPRLGLALDHPSPAHPTTEAGTAGARRRARG